MLCTGKHTSIYACTESMRAHEHMHGNTCTHACADVFVFMHAMVSLWLYGFGSCVHSCHRNVYARRHAWTLERTPVQVRLQGRMQTCDNYFSQMTSTMTHTFSRTHTHAHIHTHKQPEVSTSIMQQRKHNCLCFAKRFPCMYVCVCMYLIMKCNVMWREGMGRDAMPRCCAVMWCDVMWCDVMWCDFM